MGIPKLRSDFQDPSDPRKGPELREPAPSTTKEPRRVLRIAVCVAAAVVLPILAGAIVGLVLLNTPAFHRYLRVTLEKQASNALGVQVELQEFALHLSTLSVDLYGATIHGASPYANPPLLQVQHINAGIGITSVLRRKWYFRSIEIDRPVVQILVDKNGVSNLPTLKSGSSSGSNRTVFDLGIRHAVLNHGEVIYNNRPQALAADLHDFEYQGSFNSLQQKYSGSLSYANGRLEYGDLRPLVHNFDAHFNATPSSFAITDAKISSGASSASLSGTLNNYNDPVIEAKYDLSLDGAQVGQVLKSASVPTGMLRTAGTLDYRAATNKTLLQALRVDGSLASQQLGLKTSSFATSLDHLAGHYTLAQGSVILQDLRANVLGGRITAHGAMRNLGADTQSSLAADVRGVSLAALRQALGRATTEANIALAGSLNSNATASWGKTLDDLTARVDATIDGRVTNRAAASLRARVESAANQPMPSTIPITGAIHATYSGKSSQASLENSFLRTPQTNLTLNGTIANRSSLAVNLKANDLREVATIVDLFRKPVPGQSLQTLDLAGKATFLGNVRGSTKAPHLTGELSAEGLHLNGTDWKVVRTGVEASPSQIRLLHADLEPASRGRITLNAGAGLAQWAFTNSNPIQADVQASQINVADVEKLTRQAIPVSGTLNANLHVHGSAMNPEGNGTITLSNGVAYEEPFQLAEVNLEGTGNEAHAVVAVHLPAGSVNGNVSVRPKEKSYTASLTSTGIHLEQLHGLKARNIDATGVLTLHATGQGTFENPQMEATVQIPKLTIQKQNLSGIHLQMNVADHVALASLGSSAVGTSIQAKARVNLTGDYMTDASLDTQKIPLQTVLATYAPEQAGQITGETEVHATLRGPLKKRNLIEAHVTIPVLNAAYNNTIHLAAPSPIHVDYQNGVIHLQPASIQGTDTDLRFQGSVLASANAPMSLKIQGTVNLQLAQLFNPDIRSSGQVKFNIDSEGVVRGANLGGEVDIVDANFASPDLPVGLQHGNGVLTLTTDRINVEKFQGTIGGGSVTAQGGVAYRPGIQFDLGLAAKGIRALYPQGMRETADAYLRLTGTTERALLGGTVNISDLSFTPAFDLNSFIGQFSGGSIQTPSQGFAQNVALNVAVHSTGSVNLVSRTVSIGGDANLQLRGTVSDPVILGRVNLNGGDVILNGTRFVLAGGTVQFINPSETQPVVNMNLTTTIQQYNINLRFEGPTSQLKTQYSSDPALPQADIINLLAFGQTTEASAVAGSNTSTNQTAESLVASQVSSQVTSRVSKIAGISQLSINPVLAGSNAQGPAGANITIQQRVTGNLFVTFSTNVASTQSQTIQGQYQVSPRVAISATRDPNGGFAVDTLIKNCW